ncbi:AAA-like domain-containing protein [Microcoleus vaginatus]|uniref:AAA-like domain-containing protein n=1 Tax=Microcoleus vaginatus TaxID=119532 RepID=UPI0040409D70
MFAYPNLTIDFCGILRIWHEKGKNRGIGRKLRLVVVHSTKLYIPRSVNKSPFNVRLRPFKSDQVQDLAQGQGLDWSAEDAQQLTGFVNRNTY